MFLIKFFFTVFMADFVSGLVHWLEDAYARPGMKLVGRIAEENLRHHARPREFLQKSWWDSSSDLLLIGLVVVLASLLTHTFSFWLLFFVLLTINANQIHKWAHQGPRENPKFVTWLQQKKILQTPREHAKHHSGERNTNYCVITNYLNPVLEKIGFWKGLEDSIKFVTGVKRRSDLEYVSALRSRT
ncbi:MAG TPA: fatty acid desaturase CarF family protein [Moraxellaceae bacterium]